MSGNSKTTSKSFPRHTGGWSRQGSTPFSWHNCPVSYDLMLFAFEEGQDVDDVMNRLEAEDSRSLPSEPLRSAFTALVDDFAHEGYELAEGEAYLNIINDGFGTIIDLREEGADINVAYWHSGDQAIVVMESVIRIVSRIQQVTGWTVFDPQVGEIVTDLDALRAGAGTEMDRITRWADKNIRGAKRPWWKFWG